MPSHEECDAMNKRVDNVHVHIRELSDKFDTHHEILATHIEHFKNHEKDEVERHNQFINSQTLNTKAINDLTVSVSGVVEVYSTTKSVGKFIRWASGTVLGIGALFVYFSK